MDNQRPEAIRGKSLHAMTTEQLEELLRLEQDADGAPDVDLIEEILAVLDDRTKGEVPDADIDAALKDFKENYLSGEPLYPIPEDAQSTPLSARKKRRFRFLIAAAVLVAVLFSFGIAASATDFNLWNVIVQWSSETLGLKFGNSRETDKELNPELLELYKAVYHTGYYVKIVPHYLPDGYKQAELYVEDDAIIARYDRQDEYIFIQYRKILDDSGGHFQRDNGISKVITVEGINFHISTNLGKYLVAWATDGWECAITGVPSEEELLRMIDSIFTEE